MKHIWVDGRLAWPPVIATAYVALSLVALDYAWRRLILPFETLLMYAALIDGGLAIAIIALYFRLIRRKQTR